MGIAALGKSISALYRLGKRGLRILPDLIVGEGACSSESIAKVMKNQKGSIFRKMEAGARSVEKSVLSQKEGFFTRAWNSIKDIPSNLKKSAIDGYKAAETANKNKIWGGTKGVFKCLGNKTPLLMATWMLWSQLANVYDAVKDKGLVAGLFEAAKAPLRLGGGAAGAAIGTLCIPIPFVGPIIGWLVGEGAVNGIVGEQYNVKKAEDEMKEVEILSKYGYKKKEDGTLEYASNDEKQVQTSSAQSQQMEPSFEGNSSSNPLADYFKQESAQNNPFMAYNNPYASGLDGLNMNMNNMFGSGGYQDDIMAQTLNFNV